MKANQWRKAGAVLRWHTNPPNRPQTVGEHSWAVALLAMRFAPVALQNKLIKAALVHDIAEYELGDLPATAKWQYQHLRKEYNEAEAIVNNEAGLQEWLELSSNEANWLRLLDLTELLEFCVEEVQRGNQTFLEIFQRAAPPALKLADVVGSLPLIAYIEKMKEALCLTNPPLTAQPKKKSPSKSVTSLTSRVKAMVTRGKSAEA